HRLQVDARVHGRQLELEDQLARLERDDLASLLCGYLVQVGEVELAAARLHARAEREQSGGRIGRVRGGAAVVREDPVLAMLAVARVTAVAAVQAARVLQPPVPAPGRLQEVAAERAHRTQLRRRGEPARLAQRVGNLRARLELG